MDIIQIVGLGLIATFLALIVKEQKPQFAFLLTVFVGALINHIKMDDKATHHKQV